MHAVTTKRECEFAALHMAHQLPEALAGRVLRQGVAE